MVKLAQGLRMNARFAHGYVGVGRVKKFPFRFPKQDVQAFDRVFKKAIGYLPCSKS